LFVVVEGLIQLPPTLPIGCQVTAGLLLVCRLLSPPLPLLSYLSPSSLRYWTNDNLRYFKRDVKNAKTEIKQYKRGILQEMYSAVKVAMTKSF
jgi:hypothetical protein